MTTHSFTTDSDEMDRYLEQKANKSEYIRRLIKADMKGPDTATVGLEMQIQTLEKQAQSHAEQEELLQGQAEELREIKQEVEGKEQADLKRAKEELQGTPREPTNPAIQHWAEQVGMPPEQLCKELQ